MIRAHRFLVFYDRLRVTLAHVPEMRLLVFSWKMAILVLPRFTIHALSC
jgi:hypothetical protein